MKPSNLFSVDFSSVKILIPLSQLPSVQSRVHNKRRKGRYSTLIKPCTNALRKVCAVNHQVLSSYINTFRVTKDLMIGVNNFVVICIAGIDINIVHIR